MRAASALADPDRCEDGCVWASVGGGMPPAHWSLGLPASACMGALTWARRQLSYSEAWASCPRGDWLLWLAAHLAAPGSDERRAVADAAERWATLAGGGAAASLEAFNTADADAADADAYAGRAADVVYAVADAVADDAYADAAYATYADARAASLRLCADLVRAAIPVPPKLRGGHNRPGIASMRPCARDAVMHRLTILPLTRLRRWCEDPSRLATVRIAWPDGLPLAEAAARRVAWLGLLSSLAACIGDAAKEEYERIRIAAGGPQDAAATASTSETAYEEAILALILAFEGAP